MIIQSCELPDAIAGFSHLVLNLPTPYPNDVAQWVTDELITPALDHVSHVS
jgi:hypothetical protein